MENYDYRNDNNLKLLNDTEISDNAVGTVWRMPYISRWIHKKTTLNHLEYIKNTADKGYEEIDNSKRYSINCILFKKEFWNNIYDKVDKHNEDDEHNCLMYCYNNDKKLYLL